MANPVLCWLDRHVPMWEFPANVLVVLAVFVPIMVVFGRGWWYWPALIGVVAVTSRPFWQRHNRRRSVPTGATGEEGET